MGMAPLRDMSQAIPLYLAIGQLKTDATLEQARAELEAIHARSQHDMPSPFTQSVAVLEPLADKVVGSTRVALRLLLAAAVCVLVITCMNVAHLLLSRSSTRQKEMALRMSVGSGPRRVIRQLLAEGAAYSAIGACAGVLLAWWLTNTVIGLMGPAVPRLAETTFDVRVLAFTIVAAIVTALAFGLYPAVALSRTNVQEVLKDGARSASSSPRSRAAARSLVALQLAVTIVLVVAAGLMLRSVWHVTAYPPGFAPDEILTLRVQFSGPHYRETEARQRYVNALFTAAQSLPGVREAQLTDGRGSITLLVREGERMPEQPDAHAAPVSAVSSGFPKMWGMSLLQGRWLDDMDRTDAILINEALARREYPGVNPIGRRVYAIWSDDSERLATIVGVVSDLRYAKLDEDAVPEIFVPYQDRRLFDVTLALHIDGDPMAAAPTIVKALGAIDPTQSIFAVKTLERTLNDTIAPRRFNLLLLGTFAVTALVLVALGIYGVVAYAVAERTHEIGIRIALGAERGRVVGMIVRQNMISVVAGLVLGLAAAPFATNLMSSLLYEVEPTDTSTFAMATLGLALIAFAACVMPARRAATIDPLRALRTT
jgi:putative ABC transport system permease protein